ncbi:MAG: hypothetical protein LBC47_02835 [Tannerella sp.]|jgi:hypothetical protein|nr:hypothetical protein [Tannerella sp.]
MEIYKRRKISEESKENEPKRFESIVLAYEKFRTFISPQTREVICLNRAILAGVVRNYFGDIDRFKDYTGSDFADKHKQAAYTIKWIAKLKPIQIKIDTEDIHIYESMHNELMEINARFAIYAAFVLFLDERLMPLISKTVFDHLIYDALFRNISGSQLAFSLFLMERIVSCYYRKPDEEFKI